MKNILYVITGLNGGGAEKQLASIACGMKNRGHSVSVIAMLRPENPHIDNILKENNIPVYYLDMQRGKIKFSAMKQLRKLIKEIKPDIVHSHMIHANLLARGTRLICKMKKLICTAHSSVEGGKLRELAYRLSDPLADITTQISKGAMEGYINRKVVPIKKICYIPNGISAKEFGEGHPPLMKDSLGIKDYNFVWIAVGRMEEQKNYIGLLEAFKKVTQNTNDVVLLIAGDGQDRPKIEKFIEDNNLTDRVNLLGFRKDIPDIMKASDAFIISSHCEGFGLVIGEAMLCELPVVSTNTDGSKELVIEGENGYVVPIRNSDALADAMIKIQKLPLKERKKMGVFGRKHILENYEIEDVLDKWIKLYN